LLTAGEGAAFVRVETAVTMPALAVSLLLLIALGQVERACRNSGESEA